MPTVKIDRYHSELRRMLYGEPCSLDDRAPIIDHLIARPENYERRGELERLQDRVQNMEALLKATLMGCSKKDFRHTLQHAGLTVEGD